MPDLVSVSRDDGVAIVAIDNPPVNALDLGVRTALGAVLTRLAEDAAVSAILITGAGRTFVAGADIRELERAVWDHGVEPPDFHELLRLVEDCPQPIVMAINGTVLGGGLELAMAGHYRVAASTARLGMPEVNLGIIPGAEGTQRLPRLVGVEKALEMCVSGKPIDAEDAGRVGLVDLVIEGDFLVRALDFARDVARRDPPHPRTRARTDKRGDPAALDSLLAAARDKARKTRRHDQTAPCRGHRRDRGRSHAALRRGLPPRARASPGVRAVRASARHGARLLRRTDAARGVPTRPAARRPRFTRSRSSGGNHGHRHRDDVRLRAARGLADTAPRRWSGAGDDPEELSVVRGTGKAQRRGGGGTARADPRGGRV